MRRRQHTGELFFSSESVHKGYSQMLHHLVFTACDTDMTTSLMLQVKLDLQKKKITQPVSDKAETPAHVF